MGFFPVRTLRRMTPFTITAELPGLAGSPTGHVEILPGAVVTEVATTDDGSGDVLLTIHGRVLRVSADWMTSNRVDSHPAPVPA